MSSENADRRPDPLPDNEGVRWLSRCPPWLGSTEMAELILQHLSSVVPGTLVGWGWIDPATENVLLCLFSEEGIQHHQQPLFSDEREQSLIKAAEKLAPQLQWSPSPSLQSDQFHQIAFGLPGEKWESFQSLPTRCLQLSLSFQVFEWGLEFQRRLHVEKLASLAEYAAGAGHEINNPLGSIIGRASQLLKGEPDPERRRTLENIGAQAYRIRDMIGDTMLFARPPVPAPVTLSPVSVIHEVLEKFSEPCLRQQITVNVVSSEEFSIPFDPHQFAIVISELIRNSLYALPAGGKIDIQLEFHSQNDRDGLRIDFTDNGPGLTEEQRRHCFDPFFSGRQAGRGLGFGLSKCWQILRQHHGEIELLSSTVASTTFRLWFPLQNRNDSPESTTTIEGT